jgi:CRISPR-associated protein Cmr5
MRKTLEQERAFYCLKCVERLKLAKDGKWFGLKDFREYKLKPDSIEKLWEDDWKRMTLFDGVKKEFSRSLVSQFFGEFRKKENRRQEVNEIINLVFENLKRKDPQGKLEENEVLKEIRNYIEKSGISNLNEDIKKKINEFYIKFESRYPDYASDYSSHAKRLPQMIVSNGLIPTLAFYKSKGNDRGQIYTDICEILEVTSFKPYLDWKNVNNKEGSLLLEFLLETDFQTLRLATMEVLAIANWLKRIVEVEIKE